MQLHYAIRQKLQRPALASSGCSAARFGDEAGFSFRIQLRLVAGARAFIQRREVLLDESLAGALDRGPSDVERFGDALIRPALRGFEQNAGASQFASGGMSAAQQLLQLRALIIGQRHKVFLFRHYWSGS